MHWRQKLGVIVLCVSLALAGSAHAYTGEPVVKGITTGTTWLVKGIYTVVKYFVVEAFRPVRALTQGLTGLIGVTEE